MSFRYSFVRILLLLELSFLLTCLANALETNGRLTELKFVLNREFLLNTKACRMSKVKIGYKNSHKLSRHLVAARRTDNVTSNALLQHSSGYKAQGYKKHPSEEKELKRTERLGGNWIKEWGKEFKQKHHELVKSTKTFGQCVIWDSTERRRCCREYSTDKQGKKWYSFTNSVDKFQLCMDLIKTYTHILFEQGVILKPGDEEKLEDELNEILAEMAVNGPNEGRHSWSLPSASRYGVKGVQPMHERNSKTPKQQKWSRRQKKVLKFLIQMKRIEQMYLSDKGKSITKREKDKYSEFMESFQDCYTSNRTAVNYHTVAKRWVACGPVQFKKNVATYCADLAALNPEAPELGRKPILRWESGSNEVIKDYLDSMGYWSSRSVHDESKDEDEKGLSGLLFDDHQENDDDQEYVNVDLFGTESYCSTADLSIACYAMCCDSFFGFSYLCQTDGMQCIG